MALEAPAAPSAATTPTPEPAQTQGVAPKPTRARNEYPEAYDELESLEKPAPKPEKPAPKPAADSRPATEPAPKPPGAKEPPPKPEADKTPEKKDTPALDKALDEPGDEPDPTAQFKTAHDLRKAYRKLHKEVVPTLEREVAELRSKVESGTPAATAAMEEAKSLRKRLEEVETELRYVDYTKSAEFKEKFEKPYQDAYDDAVEEVKELRVNLPDGNTRAATAQDFQRILQADQQDVRALATELFGDAAQDVLSARRRLIELNRTANRESKRYREQAAEREKQRTLKAAEEKEGMERMWKKSVADVAEKYPQFFGKIEGDEEYNKTLETGYANVDRAHDPKIPMDEKIARMAVLRHKAAAFGAQVLALKRAKERISELEGVVAEYEKSAPGAGKGGGEDSRAPHDMGNGYASAESELDELAKTDTAD